MFTHAYITVQCDAIAGNNQDGYLMCDFFYCSRGRKKKTCSEEDIPLKQKEAKITKIHKSNKPRSCCSNTQLRNVSGVLTMAAGITLIATSNGIAAPIVAGTLTSTAGVIQIAEANTHSKVAS